MSKIKDGIGLDGIILFVSTPFDVINKYGNDYTFIDITEECFELVFSSIGLIFFCGHYDHVESECLYKYYVIEIYVSEVSGLSNSKNISPQKNTIYDVVACYGYPKYSLQHGSSHEKISLEYQGTKFIVPNEPSVIPWKIDDNLLLEIETIVICVSEETRESLIKRIKIDRWVKFIPFLYEYNWNTISDGSVIYDHNEIFYGREISRIRFNDFDLHTLYDHIFTFHIEKSVVDPNLSFNVCFYLFFKSRQSLGMALEEYFSYEDLENKADIKYISKNRHAG